MEKPCLDIIIPHYKESTEMIGKLLDSINIQVGLKLNEYVRVTIVNDHTDTSMFTPEFFAYYDFPITVLQTPVNSGAGVARQYGVDHTSLPYIMFCDADDRLYDARSLMELLGSVRLASCKGNWSYIWGDFYEEHFDKNGGYDLLIHDKPSMIWMHGKVWNRKFLEENNIRFHSNLRTYEDTYFGKIVGLMSDAKEVYHCAHPVYFWGRNPNSVTSGWNHDNKDYLYWYNHDYITSNRDSLVFLIEHNCKQEKMEEMYFNIVVFTYLILQLPEFQDQDDATREKCANMIDMIKYLNDKYLHLFNMPAQKKQFFYNTVRGTMNKYGFAVEHELYHDWLKQFGKDAYEKFKIGE